MLNKLVFLALAAGVFAVACKGSPDPTPWCSDAVADAADGGGATTTTTPTYWQDVKPIVDAKCTYCHDQGGIAPFPLVTYDQIRAEVIGQPQTVLDAIGGHLMPPWQAARCCNDYQHDWSLTGTEIATLTQWIQTAAPEGDAQHPAGAEPLLGLSRVDVTVTMPSPYLPQPTSGFDDTRCFVLDWPVTGQTFVTGVQPLPGARSIVHHMVIASVTGDTLAQAIASDGQDGRPGFDCSTATGNLSDIVLIGGGLIGGDFPDGLGVKIHEGSKILLQIHYSMGYSPPIPDQTSIQLKLDPSATEFKGIAVANPSWLIGDGMKIPAGEKDAVFWYHFHPILFTGNKTVRLRNADAHMHKFGKRFILRIIRADGTRECLLEIEHWKFGWEQPFWFKEPRLLNPDDELYVECHFDNSAENQPNGQPPRDIAWGDNNQDMCAGFLAFTEDAP